MSQFAAYIQASESLKFVMFAGVLYTFGQPFVDMLGVFSDRDRRRTSGSSASSGHYENYRRPAAQ